LVRKKTFLKARLTNKPAMAPTFSKYAAPPEDRVPATTGHLSYVARQRSN
jgi:hypothetical protein